ncbi:PD-(D/E)XK nuclease family protein [Peptoniphilus catoniae]|uniref:PD-(D/E)XK nuclease family protein n=1 Tax=Peptoniphilus catoniae TaxID=1660341 RepID=UPI0010FD537D|nr:PD-(D/E)XK nuclease family protein [Peptoniphilus catoniae]
MKVVYKTDLNKDNPDLKEIIINYLKEDKKILYICPSIESADQMRDLYIEGLKGLSGIDFSTFDSLRYRTRDKLPIDNNIIKQFIFETLSMDGYSYLSKNRGSINMILEFLRRAREDMVDPLSEPQDPLLNELFLVYRKYLDFLKNYNVTDLLENFKLNDKAFDLIIIDEFYSIKNLDLDYILNLGNTCDVLINIPYFLKDLNYSDNLSDFFAKKGFRIIDKRESSFNEIKSLYEKKMYYLKDSNSFYKNKSVFKLLKLNPTSTDIINLSGEDLNYNGQMAVEAIHINNIESTESNGPLIHEFSIFLDYLIDDSKGRLINRLKLKYFPITEKIDEAVADFSNIDFKDYYDLYNSTRREVELEHLSLSEFYDIVSALKVDVKGASDFTGYSDFLLKELESARSYIEDHYKKTANGEIYVRDKNIYNSIKNILDFFKSYDRYFETISFKQYVSLLKDYMGNITYRFKDYYAPNLYNANNFIGLKFKNLVIEGLNINYPNYGKEDPVFNFERENELRSLGFNLISFEDTYQRELLKFLRLIGKSERIYIIGLKSEEDDSSVFLNLFKNIGEIKVRDISSETELLINIIDDLEEGILREDMIKKYKSLGDYKSINKRSLYENLKGIRPMILLTDKALNKLTMLLKVRDFYATDFDKYMESPYEFLYETLVGIGELIEDRDTYYMDLGKLYHKILENYIKTYTKLNRDLLKDMIAREMRINDPNKVSFNAVDKAKLNNLTDTLFNFIKMDIENRNGYRPVEFELPFSLDLGEFKIKGRIDRIDDFEGFKIITDYKSSKSDSIKDIKNLTSLQMPIYMLSQDSVVELRYGLINKGEYKIVLSNSDIRPETKASMTGEEINDLMKGAYRVLIEIYADIASGNFTGGNLTKEIYRDLFREARD